jgi:hypothetical protein
MTLGRAAAAKVRLIVWCKDCQHQVSLTRPRWPLGKSPKRACSIGASGWLQQPPGRYGGKRNQAAVAGGALANEPSCSAGVCLAGAEVRVRS